jgi:hypothetical protein
MNGARRAVVPSSEVPDFSNHGDSLKWGKLWPISDFGRWGQRETSNPQRFLWGCDVASFWRWSNECNECFWSLIEKEDELLMNHVFFCFRPTVETIRKQFFVWFFSFLPTLEYLSVRLKWLKSKANPSRSKQPDTTLISAQCQLVCDALLKERSCP